MIGYFIHFSGRYTNYWGIFNFIYSAIPEKFMAFSSIVIDILCWPADSIYAFMGHLFYDLLLLFFYTETLIN